MTPEEFAKELETQAEAHRMFMQSAINVGNKARENYHRGAMEQASQDAADVRFALVAPPPPAK